MKTVPYNYELCALDAMFNHFSIIWWQSVNNLLRKHEYMEETIDLL